MKAILGFRHGMNALAVCNVLYAVILRQLVIRQNRCMTNKLRIKNTLIEIVFFGAVLSRTF